jgi:hypothetical protein
MQEDFEFKEPKPLPNCFMHMLGCGGDADEAGPGSDGSGAGDGEEGGQQSITCWMKMFGMKPPAQPDGLAGEEREKKRGFLFGEHKCMPSVDKEWLVSFFCFFTPRTRRYIIGRP